MSLVCSDCFQKLQKDPSQDIEELDNPFGCYCT